MNNCLLKKYKVSTNNPDLPILETMQQFTLDAITASGNSAMTDEQKWALNHFFYQIGAIGNNSMWQKVKQLYMPMICGDNLSTAFNDYKNNTTLAASSSHTFVNHGLSGISAITTLGTNIFTGKSHDLSCLVITMGNGIPVNSGGTGMFIIDKNISDRINTLIRKASIDNNFILPTIDKSEISSPPYVGDNVFDIASYTSSADYANGKLISTKSETELIRNLTSEELNSRNSEITYSNNYLRIRIDEGFAFGLGLLSSALTAEERDSIMLAAKDLKLAFSESNS